MCVRHCSPFSAMYTMYECALADGIQYRTRLYAVDAAGNIAMVIKEMLVFMATTLP